MQTITNYIDAEKRRREEEGEKGFSLIELIIVVVILGILVAVAIPLIGNLQATATENAARADAANVATTIAAAIAEGTPLTEAPGASSTDWTLTVSTGGLSSLDDLCVTASIDGTALTPGSGPGC